MSEMDNRPEASRFSFAPRQMTDENIATSIASGNSRRRTQIILLAISTGLIFLLMMGLIGFDESNLELQVSVEKADIDQAGNVNLEGLSYRGVTKDGNDFVLLSETASENTDTPDRVLMTSPVQGLIPKPAIRSPSGPMKVTSHATRIPLTSRDGW